MAGVLAASLSESGIIGVVGGREDVPPVVKLVNGYEVGRQVRQPGHQRAEDLQRVLRRHRDKGASDAQQFIGEGADVIFGAGGKTGSGGVVDGHRPRACGASASTRTSTSAPSTSGAAPGSEYLASSAVKRVDLGVFLKILDAIKGEFAGGIFGLTAENGGITYAPFHDADDPRRCGRTPSRRPAQGLADGSITTGLDPATGLPLVGQHARTERGWRRPPPLRSPPTRRGMSDEARPILEVRGVTKTFPGVIANEDVDLTLHEGQVLCVLGENGAGKSTLMNTVFGLYQPDAGEILAARRAGAVRQLARRHRAPASGWCTSTSS